MIEWIIVVASVLPGILILGVTFSLLGWAGGWRAVARIYPASGSPHGTRFGMQRCKFGWVDYNGCMTMHVSAEGLRIAVWWIFRFGHPTLFIPWSALHVREVIENWWCRDIVLSIGEPEIARLRLPLKIIEAAENFRAVDPMWREINLTQSVNRESRIEFAISNPTSRKSRNDALASPAITNNRQHMKG